VPDILNLAIVAAAAFIAAGLTLYSGFGLGTLMLPVFALFFPVEMAVVATALVHGANNVFKVVLLGRQADREVVLKFGLPAIAAAVLGALALGWFAQAGSSFSIGIAIDGGGRRLLEITPVKLVIGLLMIGFALFELLPRFQHLEFERRWLPLGGVLSGFFGGLSGHQGALRSAFLAKAGLDTQRFVGSNAVIGFLVDLTRLGVYLSLFAGAGVAPASFGGWPLVATGALAAFAGVLVGRRYLHKVTMKSIRILVAALLLGVGCALLTGLL
jgi:uncharacterized membrane protein YfcA